MSAILDSLKDHPLQRFEAGTVIIEEGTSTGRLLVLAEGAVSVMKGDVQVATAAEPGAVFGELSALLGTPHTATVRTTQPCAFYVVEEPLVALETTPKLALHVCELLGRRLDALNKYLVDVKHQYEGHDHLSMVDGVLETLMHRQPRQHIRPSDSTIRKSEPAE
ncbi:MAG: cyclic nucleotide-binding domain-containing protein [Chthoniobacteraceae bacterium]